MLGLSHAAVAGAGFAAGIYVLPILTAPPSPDETEVRAAAARAGFRGQFRRDLKDSDALHWGEGEIAIGATAIAFTGRLAPGPDYKLYLSPEFVETEAGFARLKSRMVRVGEVKTFGNFVIPVPKDIDVSQYNTAIVWCETFSQFITAAKYR